MYVYLLRCKDGSLYAGSTTDLDRRFALHAAGKGAKYTRSHPPVSIAAAWQVRSGSDALRLEAQLKRLVKCEKERLVREGAVCTPPDACSDAALCDPLLGVPAMRVR